MKVAVVGHTSEIESIKSRLYGHHKDVELVHVNTIEEIAIGEYAFVINNTSADCSVVENFKRGIAEMETLPDLEDPFYPKKKHSPKGYERPYRYHK